MEDQPVETTLYSLDEAPPKSRRKKTQAARHLSLYRVGALTVGERRELCLIKNISVGGMLIKAYSDIPAGTRLSVELKQGEPVSGIAQWTEKDAVGIGFDAPIDIVSLISARVDGLQSRMPRIEIDCVAAVRDGACVVRAAAINISQGGLRLKTSHDFAIGATVIVTMTGFPPEPAVVKWSDDGSCGLVFNRVLSVTQLVAWLKSQQEGLRAAG